MKKFLVLILLSLILFTGCNTNNQDSTEIKGSLGMSRKELIKMEGKSEDEEKIEEDKYNPEDIITLTYSRREMYGVKGAENVTLSYAIINDEVAAIGVYFPIDESNESVNLNNYEIAKESFKLIYGEPTKERKDIEEFDYSCDWNSSEEYVCLFLNKHTYSDGKFIFCFAIGKD